MISRVPLFVLLAALSVLPASAESRLEPPIPVRMFAPEYPSDMRRQNISGVVMVKCLIDEEGNVREPTIQKASNSAFETPALDALKKWKFKPAQRDGTLVPMLVTIPIRFNCNP
jgi:protein TonB